MISPTKLLFDADVLSYRLAYSCRDEPDSGVVDRSIIKLVGEIIEWLDPFGFIHHNQYYFYLTGSTNFRFDIAKGNPYKGNRRSEKPEWLPYIREYFIKRYNAVVSVDCEADDLIATECHKNNYENVVIISTDKDFRQLPVPIFNPTKFEIATNNRWESTKYFYQQILTGDAVDNIIGIKGVGPVKANVILSECDSEVALYKAVVEAYKADYKKVTSEPDDIDALSNATVLENAKLLWLKRFETDDWEPPNAS